MFKKLNKRDYHWLKINLRFKNTKSSPSSINVPDKDIFHFVLLTNLHEEFREASRGWKYSETKQRRREAQLRKWNDNSAYLLFTFLVYSVPVERNDIRWTQTIRTCGASEAILPPFNGKLYGVASVNYEGNYHEPYISSLFCWLITLSFYSLKRF